MKQLIKTTLPLAIVAVCLFVHVLNCESGVFRELQATLLALQWMLLVCIAVWCGTFFFLTFSRSDSPLIGLLLIAIVAYFINYLKTSQGVDAIILLSGVTLGKGVRVLLSHSRRREPPLTDKTVIDQSVLSCASAFIIELVILLAFTSWWHLDMANAYHGPRWTGFCDNPNIYGMLMSAGVVLAVGLLAGRQKLLQAILSVAAGMMAVGLLFSYSRGAWLGVAVGLLYLGKAKSKFKWRFVLPVVFVVGSAVWFFWSSTPDTSPWYLKRMDLSRPSAQHRVVAWKAGFEIIRDHPFGVGWNKAVETYDKHYSPPENGAAAITTNDYLMLGTQLGLPALICFVTYIYLKFKPKATDSSHVACRAGVLVLLVAFWFDGGLFDLPTATVFWVLLELGTSDLIAKPRHQG
jgi:hypothetical protein